MRPALLIGLTCCAVCGSAACGTVERGTADDANADGADAAPGLPDPDDPDAGAGAVSSWGTPTLVPGVDSTSLDVQGTMTADLLRICFTSNRPGGAGGADIWCAARSSPTATFAAPQAQTLVNTADDDWQPSLRPDGAQLYFASNRAGGAGSHDLYRATWNATIGRFELIQRIAELDTAAGESGPSIDATGTVLHFDSDRAGGAGSLDLYRATRPSADAPFDAPVRLGVEANGAGMEAEAGRPGDAALLFCSDRASGVADPFTLWRGTAGGAGPARVDLDDDGAGGCGPELLSDGGLLFHSARATGGALYLAPPATAE